MLGFLPFSDECCIAFRGRTVPGKPEILLPLFHRLGQLYNVEFTVCSPEINRYVYHAVFTDETLPEILDMLRISAPIRYEILQSDSPDPNSPKQQIRVYAN